MRIGINSMCRSTISFAHLFAGTFVSVVVVWCFPYCILVVLVFVVFVADIAFAVLVVIVAVVAVVVVVIIVSVIVVVVVVVSRRRRARTHLRASGQQRCVALISNRGVAQYNEQSL